MNDAWKTTKSTPEQALEALRYIIPILEKYQFKWVITGGFATFVYGVGRPVTDIDLDIDTSKDSPEFQEFVKEIEPYVTQPLDHFVDQNYDNYNVELTYNGQILDICTMPEMNVVDKDNGGYVNFYKDGFPEIEMMDFHGIRLPLLAKHLIIKNKEMLVWQRESDHADIAGLRALLQN